MSASRPESATSDRSVLQHTLPQQLAGTIKARFHGFLRKQEDVAYVPVAQVHEVPKYDDRAQLRIDPHQPLLDRPAHLLALDPLFRSRSLVCLLATHPLE